MKYDQSKFDKIDALNEEYRSLASGADLNALPAIAVVYENMYYPIIADIDYFFYLGGSSIRMILKTKCVLKDTGKTMFYEAVASDHDIEMGKSPIVPIGCPTDKNITSSNVKKLEQSLV